MEILKNKEKLIETILSLSPPFNSICGNIVGYNKFFECPGGVNHHAYKGGLLSHTLEVINYCEHFLSFKSANRDILITATLWHDLGKIWEYQLDLDDNCRICVTKTKQATTLHHTYTSIAEFTLNAALYNLNQKTIEEIQHCIASHHYYTPQRNHPILPQTIEALILCNCDHLSAMFGETKYATSN